MKTIIQLCICFLALNAFNQGAHYSLLNELNHQINPALVGFEVQNNRVALNHRKQWNALGFAYNSSNIRFEKKIDKQNLLTSS